MYAMALVYVAKTAVMLDAQRFSALTGSIISPMVSVALSAANVTMVPRLSQMLTVQRDIALLLDILVKVGLTSTPMGLGIRTGSVVQAAGISFAQPLSVLYHSNISLTVSAAENADRSHQGRVLMARSLWAPVPSRPAQRGLSVKDLSTKILMGRPNRMACVAEDVPLVERVHNVTLSLDTVKQE